MGDTVLLNVILEQMKPILVFMFVYQLECIELNVK